MNDEQLTDAKTKLNTEILHFPAVLGADVPSYNIPGIGTDLNFTPEALAGIVLGKITKWNDPELKKANPKVELPDQDIVVVHHSKQ
jgi:phosphate transport system substrate-binding protein